MSGRTEKLWPWPRRPLLPRGRARRRAAAGPSFWLDLLADLDLPAEELHTALWDLAAR